MSASPENCNHRRSHRFPLSWLPNRKKDARKKKRERKRNNYYEPTRKKGGKRWLGDVTSKKVFRFFCHEKEKSIISVTFLQLLFLQRNCVVKEREPLNVKCPKSSSRHKRQEQKIAQETRRCCNPHCKHRRDFAPALLPSRPEYGISWLTSRAAPIFASILLRPPLSFLRQKRRILT